MGTHGLTWSCALWGASGPLDHSACSSGQPHFCQGRPGGLCQFPQYKHPRQAVSPSPRGSSENTRTNEPKQLLGLKSLWRLGACDILGSPPSLFSPLPASPGHHQELRGSCSLRGLGWEWGAEPSMAPLLPQGGWKARIQCAQGLWGQKSWGQTSRNTGAGRETGGRSFTLRAVKLHFQRARAQSV